MNNNFIFLAMQGNFNYAYATDGQPIHVSYPAVAKTEGAVISEAAPVEIIFTNGDLLTVLVANPSPKASISIKGRK